MKTVYDIYKKLENTAETYFAGANTASGFVGEYADIADERKLERLYIIKGGSGTGKSTLMKKCAEMAENDGFEVKYYLCGSDPDSLDCVVIDDRIAILDGTAPHTLDMKYPIAASEIVDVSQFLNSDILENSRESIVELCGQKSLCYASAYRYLTAVSELEKERAYCTDAIFLQKKAEACIDRFIKKLGKPKGKRGTLQEVRTHALTMKGAVSLDTFDNLAEEKYIVADHLGCAVPFMSLLTEKLTAAGFSVTAARLPAPDITAEIFIEDCGVCIATEDTDATDGHIINMARFAGESPIGVRGEFRLASKIQLSCLDEALAKLKHAADFHFELEKIYISAMDFTLLDNFTGSVIDKIRSRLNG